MLKKTIKKSARKRTGHTSYLAGYAHAELLNRFAMRNGLIAFKSYADYEDNEQVDYRFYFESLRLSICFVSGFIWFSLVSDFLAQLLSGVSIKFCDVCNGILISETGARDPIVFTDMKSCPIGSGRRYESGEGRHDNQLYTCRCFICNEHRLGDGTAGGSSCYFSFVPETPRLIAENSGALKDEKGSYETYLPFDDYCDEYIKMAGSFIEADNLLDIYLTIDETMIEAQNNPKIFIMSFFCFVYEIYAKNKISKDDYLSRIDRYLYEIKAENFPNVLRFFETIRRKMARMLGNRDEDKNLGPDDYFVILEALYSEY